MICSAMNDKQDPKQNKNTRRCTRTSRILKEPWRACDADCRRPLVARILHAVLAQITGVTRCGARRRCGLSNLTLLAPRRVVVVSTAETTDGTIGAIFAFGSRVSSGRA